MPAAELLVVVSRFSAEPRAFHTHINVYDVWSVYLCKRRMAFACPVLTCKQTMYLCITKSLNCHLFIADHTYISELGIELQTRASPLSPHRKMTPMMEPYRYYCYLLRSSSGDAVTIALFATLS